MFTLKLCIISCFPTLLTSVIYCPSQGFQSPSFNLLKDRCPVSCFLTPPLQLLLAKTNCIQVISSRWVSDSFKTNRTAPLEEQGFDTLVPNRHSDLELDTWVSACSSFYKSVTCSQFLLTFRTFDLMGLNFITFLRF